MVVLAHLGHWIGSLIYAAPALLLAGALAVSTIRQRRAEEARRAAARRPAQPTPRPR